MSHTEQAFNSDQGDLAGMVDAYQLDLRIRFGSASGQEDSFQLLSEYATDCEGGMVHAYMLGYGLALADTAEDRRFVIDLASFFLVAG
ncbi:hypothetical protein [Stutzerimonas nitrititolerans]|jgi:hypothetical protein|uniref:hypothetical protein n=1 Tax=Stutzerimonas nitrititolerans TaxID=2482751 RepID=UPI0028AA0ADC|nr:hypothetical protein [Stutzerimonas nitrititolerans]